MQTGTVLLIALLFVLGFILAFPILRRKSKLKSLASELGLTFVEPPKAPFFSLQADIFRIRTQYDNGFALYQIKGILNSHNVEISDIARYRFYMRHLRNSTVIVVDNLTKEVRGFPIGFASIGKIRKNLLRMANTPTDQVPVNLGSK